MPMMMVYMGAMPHVSHEHHQTAFPTVTYDNMTELYEWVRLAYPSKMARIRTDATSLWTTVSTTTSLATTTVTNIQVSKSIREVGHSITTSSSYIPCITCITTISSTSDSSCTSTSGIPCIIGIHCIVRFNFDTPSHLQSKQ
jgi:hypothetical protein